MKQINSPEGPARLLTESNVEGDIQAWMTDLIFKNWETVVAGGLFFLLVGTDVVAISRDVLADGKVDFRDKDDVLALGRGSLRIVATFAGAMALKYALERNPMATLATLTAGVVAGVGVSKTVELAKSVKSQKGTRARLNSLASATATALVTGAAVGALELGAAQIDSEAWVIANVGLLAVTITRPKETVALIEQTRMFIG